MYTNQLVCMFPCFPTVEHTCTYVHTHVKVLFVCKHDLYCLLSLFVIYIIVGFVYLVRSLLFVCQ